MCRPCSMNDAGLLLLSAAPLSLPPRPGDTLPRPPKPAHDHSHSSGEAPVNQPRTRCVARQSTWSPHSLLSRALARVGMGSSGSLDPEVCDGMREAGNVIVPAGTAETLE
jgi:hypothetical protein